MVRTGKRVAVLEAALWAAGMAATFGTPLAAVVIAIELLLFEFSPRAFVPLAIASSVAAGMHALIFGTGPLFSVRPFWISPAIEQYVPRSDGSKNFAISPASHRRRRIHATIRGWNGPTLPSSTPAAVRMR